MSPRPLDPVVNRRSVAPLVLAALAVLALATVAATLPQPVPTASDGTGEGEGGGVGPGAGGGAGTVDGGFERPDWLAVLVELLFAFLQLVAAFAVLVFLALLVAFRDHVLAALLDTLRRLPKQLLAVLALFAVGLATLVVLFYVAPETGRPRPAPIPAFPGGGGGESGAQATPAVPDFLVPLVVAGLSVAAVAVLLWRRGRRADGDADDAESPTSTTDASEAVGEAAGRAAERIAADADASNAVFDAWREMTDELGGDRRTTTPRTFAERAVTAGMDPDDVETLTRLFEDVRYGDREVTPAVEQRALETFRRIEAAYADGGDDASAPAVDRDGAGTGGRSR
jgi:hypothetical protein